MRSLAVMLGFLLLLQPTTGVARPSPHFDLGVQALKKLEYTEAVDAFQKALDWPGNTRRERATIHLYIGIARSNLTEYEAAEASFKKALEIDPMVDLPQHTSPKITALFERVRSELKAKAPQPATQPQPAPAPTPRPEPEPEPRPSDVKRSRIQIAAWTTLGVAVAAGGAGLALGLMNRSSKQKAEDPSIPYQAALAHADDASSYGLGANLMFATAGVAAVTSGILFYLGVRSRKQVSAAVVPSGNGLLVTLETRR